MIRQRHYSPEYSVSRALRHYAKVIQSLDGDYMPERANDIFDIEKRLLRHLFGKRREELAHINAEVLVLAHNLTPSETSNLESEVREGVRHGNRRAGSHTAIVAEALGIPAVVGIGPFLTDVSGGETAIIDGYQGLVILHPDEETLARYRHEVVQYRSHAAKLEKLRDLPAETADGVRIQLLGNIEFPVRSRAVPEARGRRHRPVSHRVPVHVARRGADRRGADGRLLGRRQGDAAVSPS